MRNSITNKRAGFSLVEVVVALGVTTFCILTLMALLGVGINSDKTTVQRSIAANIADAVMADLRATPLATQSYSKNLILNSPRFRFALPAPTTGTAPQTVYVATDGTPVTAIGAPLSTSIVSGGTFRVSVSGPFRPSGTQRTASPVYILVTWPGQADPDPTKWPSNYTGSFEVVTYLDQN